MASLGSSIRSAAQGTFSAYRRLPIRWRLAGGSAALTLVILLGFAVIVGLLTTRRIQADFNRQTIDSAERVAGQLKYHADRSGDGFSVTAPVKLDLLVAGQNAAVRIVDWAGRNKGTPTSNAPDFGRPRSELYDTGGWRVVTLQLQFQGTSYFRQPPALFVQYARPLSEIRATANRMRALLAFGVLGGAALALLAGLATARRAMAPIARLTDVARRIERTRDASVTLPAPEAEDEVAELARTLQSMLEALDDARHETEATLSRQREFVADASHELRTPLTSVLANLELLEYELHGDQRDTASSALRSSRRMRRLVADLLLLARADAGRRAPHRPVDLSEVVTDAASELEPVAGDHEISISAPSGLEVDGARDELHRLVLNLMENALRHTDPGTAVEASVTRENGHVIVAVEDDGPGIPQELREKVFERFFRGEGDRSGSSGLGLSIVRAVAAQHGGTVTLAPPLDGRGARFVVRLPALMPAAQHKTPAHG